MSDRAERILPTLVPELAHHERRAKAPSIAPEEARRFPASFPLRLVALLSKARASLTIDDRKELAPLLREACGETQAECGRIAGRDRRTMNDYENPELRGKVMPSDVIDTLEDYAVWKANNARFARVG